MKQYKVNSDRSSPSCLPMIPSLSSCCPGRWTAFWNSSFEFYCFLVAIQIIVIYVKVPLEPEKDIQIT